MFEREILINHIHIRTVIQMEFGNDRISVCIWRDDSSNAGQFFLSTSFSKNGFRLLFFQ